ncbi:hypothetical protein [Luteimonas aquatica]|uniref:hypothetical protein n=1 Tax=Luteimonas aquatica TaxID=450364 RepID=UPI001F58C8DB|nr:hypothetical protein [Luteimonas aquatica]
MKQRTVLSFRPRRWALAGVLAVASLSGGSYAYPLPPAGHAGVVEYYGSVIESAFTGEETVTGWYVYYSCPNGGPITWGSRSGPSRIVFVPCP